MREFEEDQQAEEAALQTLKECGLKVDRNPKIDDYPQLKFSGQRPDSRPDALLRDAKGQPRTFSDVYAPRTDSLRNIWQVVESKGSSQARSVIVNSNTPNSRVPAEDFVAYARVTRPVSVEEIYIIGKDGRVTYVTW